MERTSDANLAQQRRSSLRNTAQPGGPFIYRTESKVKESFHKIIFKIETKRRSLGRYHMILEKTWEECCWFERVIDRLSTGKGLKDQNLWLRPIWSVLLCGPAEDDLKHTICNFHLLGPLSKQIKIYIKHCLGRGRWSTGARHTFYPVDCKIPPKSWGRLPTSNWKKVILEDFQKFF